MSMEYESSFARRLGKEELAKLLELESKGTPLAKLARDCGMNESMLRMALRRAQRKTERETGHKAASTA